MQVTILKMLVWYATVSLPTSQFGHPSTKLWQAFWHATTSSLWQYFPLPPIVACDGGYARLVNDERLQRRIIKDTVSTGRVEMCLNGEFRTICADDWNNAAASVLCSQLGLSRFGKKL